jgi:hypothetical protein
MLRRFWYACLGALVIAWPAQAEVSRIDYSDLWWNPSENGWGLGLQRQGEVMFAALFLYADDGSSSWYFASDMRAADEPARAWSGKLYRATGPTFSAPFDAATVTEVGTARIDFFNASAGQLVYSVNGTTVTKSIERMTWRIPSIDGSYHGGLSTAVSQCTNPNFDGTLDLMGPLTVTTSGMRTTLAITSGGLSGSISRCTFSGERQQAGREGSIEGTFSCSLVTGRDDRNDNNITDTRNGSFVLERIAVSASGMSARLAAVDQDCSYLGTFGGVKLP